MPFRKTIVGFGLSNVGICLIGQNYSKKHIGKRTMMVYDKGTCLLVEGIGFEIVDDSRLEKAG